MSKAERRSLASSMPVQWIDSYHTQLMTNSYGSLFSSGAPRYDNLSSNFAPDQPPLGVGPTGGQNVINTAFAPLVNTSASGIPGTGYVLGAGGFDQSTNVNVPDTTVGDANTKAGCTTDGTATVSSTNTDLRCGGGISILTRNYQTTDNVNWATSHESNISNWEAVPNFLDPNTLPNTPAVWTQVAENLDGTKNQIIPFLGGATMLPGFNLMLNEVVYFGGIDCRAYVDDASAPCTTFRNPGRYWSFNTIRRWL